MCNIRCRTTLVNISNATRANYQIGLMSSLNILSRQFTVEAALHRPRRESSDYWRIHSFPEQNVLINPMPTGMAVPCLQEGNRTSFSLPAQSKGLALLIHTLWSNAENRISSSSGFFIAAGTSIRCGISRLGPRVGHWSIVPLFSFTNESWTRTTLLKTLNWQCGLSSLIQLLACGSSQAFDVDDASAETHVCRSVDATCERIHKYYSFS